VTGTAQALGAFSLSGIPPFSGFWSKLIIILAAVQAGHPWYAFWTVLGSLLTLSALLKALKEAYWGAPSPRVESAREAPPSMVLPMIGLAFLTVMGGMLLLPGIRQAFLGKAVETVMEGTRYSKIILEGLR
jgi:multicomponent Na+:H+ antiporter subunit D